MTFTPQNNPESGNALWFILLAVALLAALTITITRSSDSTEQTGDIERARVQASELMRFASGVEQAIAQMRLNGTSENEISFDGVAALAGYANTRCTDNSCRIFDRAGTGVTYQSPAESVSAQEWLFTGANSIVGVGSDGSGASSSADNELMMIAMNIPETLCARINTDLGITGIPQDTGQVNLAATWQGTFPNGLVLENPAGRKTGCFEGNQDQASADISGQYYFYHTLIAR